MNYLKSGKLTKSNAEELLSTIGDILQEGMKGASSEDRKKLADSFFKKAQEVHDESGGHYTEGSPNGIKVRTLRAFANHVLMGE